MNALLLGDPSPSLRWRAAVELDGASENDEEVKAWRAEIDGSEELRALVAQLGAARDNPQTAGYLLCRLTYLGYRGPELAAAVDGIFAHQQPDGSWPYLPDDEPTPKRRRGSAPPGVFSAEPYTVLTMQTLVPLRGVAAAGFATDPRAERAYEWLLDQRLDDGSWTGSHRGSYGFDFRSTGGGDPAYRKLTRGKGCRSTTTGAAACLALHPDRSPPRRRPSTRTRDPGPRLPRLGGLTSGRTRTCLGTVHVLRHRRPGLRPRPCLPMRRLR
jgi:hypothetical protein